MSVNRADPVFTQKFKEYTVTGMDCADCALHVERAVKKIPGVSDTRVNLLNGQMEVYTSSELPEDDLIFKAVRDAGYDIRPVKSASYGGSDSVGWQKSSNYTQETVYGRLFYMTLFSGLFMLSAQVCTWIWNLPLAASFLFMAAVITGGVPVIQRGLNEARNIRPGMNLLMSLAIIGAAVLGEWNEAAMVVFLFALAQYLESRTMNRARVSINSLMDQRPKTAKVKMNGTYENVPVESIRIGQIMAIKPGENIPVDGIVISGASSVDQSGVTGESIPVDVTKGDNVFAGTLNKSGYLEIRADKEYNQSTFARILDLVARAQSQKSPYQTFVEKFSLIYTPLVILLAFLVAIFPPLVMGLSWTKWIYRALVLLVIACPCAFVISTPVTVISGLTHAMRRGILIKGGKYLEFFARVKAIAFDKTGTLTEGKLRIREIIALNGQDGRLILQQAAALAARSAHPVSEAIADLANQEGLTLPEVHDFITIEGMGLQGNIGGDEYLLGNHRFFESRGWCDQSIHEKLNGIEDSNYTAVLFGKADNVIALIAISDNMRRKTAETIHQLRQEGVNHIHLLTGDNLQTARAIASEAEVDDYDAELLPEDKVAVVSRLKDDYRIVAMVGDGINDAPALAHASVGIAMGARGSATAMETADITLMSDNISQLVFLKKLSRKTIHVIKENIFIALSMKFIFLLLAIPGLATLWMAVFADMGASLIVIFNGLRVLNTRSKTTL